MVAYNVDSSSFSSEDKLVTSFVPQNKQLEVWEEEGLLPKLGLAEQLHFHAQPSL